MSLSFEWLICDFQDFDFLLKIFVDDIDGVPLTICYHLCFLPTPKVWSMFQWDEFKIKNIALCLRILLDIFLLFFKTFVLLSFLFPFFDEVSFSATEY